MIVLKKDYLGVVVSIVDREGNTLVSVKKNTDVEALDFVSQVEAAINEGYRNGVVIE
jgi:hypothetical protein